MGNQLRAGQKNVYSKLLKKFKNRREAIGERGDQNPIPEKGVLYQKTEPTLIRFLYTYKINDLHNVPFLS